VPERKARRRVIASLWRGGVTLRSGARGVHRDRKPVCDGYSLRDQRPDLIITAPTLPGMNALDLLSLLADDARAPPVAVHLADDNWPLRHMATRLGAVAVLQDQQLAERLPGLLEQVGHRTGAARVRPAIAGQIPARSSPADAQILATATAASGGHCGRTVIWLAVVCLAFGLVIGLAL
jgi:CheY-like chemotaxis protein